MTQHTVNKGFIKRYSDSILAFSVMLCVTAGIVSAAYTMQKQYTKTTFDTLADRQAELLKTNVENDLKFIGAGANFFHSIERTYWSSFPMYAEQVINSSRSLIGLQWMKKVEFEDLDKHILKTRQTFPDFRPFTVPQGGSKTYGYIFEHKKPIFIASDIYPRTPENLSLLGFYFSRERFDLILEDISTKKRANISDKVRLLQDGYDKSIPKTGLLVFHPVFDFENQYLLGVVTGVIRSTVYFENLVTKTATELDMSVRVEDLGYDAEDGPVLFQSSNWEDVRGCVTSRTIQLSNREWRIDFKLSDAVSAWERSILASTMLAGGVIAFLISWIVNLQSREKERLAVMLELKTIELKRMAERDPLTQLLNRRVFNDHLLNHINKGIRFALVGFDIDHFKVINDKYGHLGGDEALQHVTKLVSAHLKPGDKFYRAGGDEFCIISKVIDKAVLEVYLETLRSIVASTPFYYADALIICTLSIGAVIHEDEDPESLYHKMDNQLYVSKKNGRNRVSIGD